MINVNFWLALGGIATVLSVLGTLGLWALRKVVGEILEPVKEDIHVLKVAAFNHLSHGQKPDEATIRAALGFRERTRT